jgi:hypothetical protein
VFNIGATPYELRCSHVRYPGVVVLSALLILANSAGQSSAVVHLGTTVNRDEATLIGARPLFATQGHLDHRGTT